MESLTVFIRRPVLATMVTALLLVLGYFSYRTLGVDLMPKIEFPMVTVTTVLRGASPEEIESQITKPIEEVVNTVSGIDELNSVSMEGVSRVAVRFLLERSIAEAVQDVRDKVATVIARLPEGTEPPIITKIDFDAIPVVTLTVTADRDLKEVSEIARLKVKEAIENVDGVGAVIPAGAWKRAINVEVDVDKLFAYGLPISRLKTALLSQNVEIPSGRIDRGDSEQVLRTMARLDRVAEFSRLVVANRGGGPVTLGDVAAIKDGVEEPRSMARLWRKGDPGRGRPSVSLVVQKQSGTNTIEVIERVKKRLAEIAPRLPKDVAIGVVSDQSRFISTSIAELKLHLVLGGILAALAVLLFMRNWRSTVIAALAIPTSLVATFTLMRALDFTLNNMSLLGLTLAVGIVIDDAIVVLENVFRHMEEHHKDPLQAAIDGLTEIGLAVMATTTSLMVIFLPVAFMQGMVGRFFYQFGMTVAFAIGISLVVSFTLTPMLSSRFLRPAAAAASSKANRVWQAIEASYGWILRAALEHRLATVLLALGLVATTAPLLAVLGKDFLPVDDRSEFQVTLIAPAGTSLEATSELFGKVEDAIHALEGPVTTLTQIGSADTGGEDVTRGSIYIAIEDLEARPYPQSEVMKQVRQILRRFPELRSAVNDIGGLSGTRGGYGFSYSITGPDLEALMQYSDALAAKIRRLPGFVDVDTSLAARQPEVAVHIDRAKAADLGITAAELATSLRTLVGGEPVSKFREGVEQYDVWLRLAEADRDSAARVARHPLLAQSGALVALQQVADLTEGRSPTQVDRYNRQRLVTVYANLDGLDLASAITEVNAAAKEISFAPGYRGVALGRAKMMGETMRNMGLAFLLAFIFMYIVLAAQFESFLHPITILLSLPLTLPFALLSLLLLQETMNLYSLLGVFMLFGIVKKNGILQIDYTNTLRAKGREIRAAILEANHARLRPILMTTLTLIAGMTPIALGNGPGAAARASLAKVIVGGQALSLVITLVIVPVAYSLFEDLKVRLGRNRQPL
ncbi:MAG: efflux RND transporter permease subunit [Deltaproteobacteria bacterium]|nr:efflux RND transporter permease subunit [Deltaproteobacteria bacterium]